MSDHVSAGDGGEVDPRHTAGPTAISAQASASSGADAVTPPTVDRANATRTRDLKDPQPHLVVMFSVVTLALFMQSADTTIVATALHTLQRGLHTSINWAGWTITVYSVGMVLSLPLSARFSDRFGRKRVFLISVAAFATASLLCGVATNIFELIVLRALQAVGGAGLTPSATGLVVEHFGDARDRAVGLFGSVFQIGALTGPILGGLFVTYLSWRWIFFVNVPISIALIVLGARVIPRDPTHASREHAPLDARGMVLLGAGILFAMIGMTYLGEPSARSWVVAAVALTTAIVVSWRFLRRAHSVANPFIAPRLIHGQGFGAINIINVLYGGATAGVLSLVPLYATNRYHIGTLASGTLLTASAIAAIILSILSALALRRTGYRVPMYVGAVLRAAGLFGLATRPFGDASAYAWLAVSAALVGAGNGWADPAARNAGLQLMPDQSAAIAALRTMGRRVGTIASVSIVTAVIAATASPGTSQAYTFAGFGALVLVATLTIPRVPEHRGSW
jgi:EmrB/QacA subfamily drug resistance transporter